MGSHASCVSSILVTTSSTKSDADSCSILAISVIGVSVLFCPSSIVSTMSYSSAVELSSFFCSTSVLDGLF